MIKKILYLLAVLTFSLNISNKPILAGPFADEMAKCLVTSTNKRDRTKLIKWIFRVYGDHPEVSYMIDLSYREKKLLIKMLPIYLLDYCLKIVLMKLKRL